MFEVQTNSSYIKEILPNIQCHTFFLIRKWSIERHHMGATPSRLYSPRLLIVRRPKSGTAKTVPAVPAAPALLSERQMS